MSELTIEQALNELRETAYEGAIVECRFDVSPLKITGSFSISVWERNGATDSKWRDFGGKTLPEAMAQVRAWKENRTNE